LFVLPSHISFVDWVLENQQVISNNNAFIDEEESLLSLLKQGIHLFFKYCKEENIDPLLVQILDHTLRLDSKRWSAEQVLSSAFWPRKMIPPQKASMKEIKLPASLPSVAKLLPLEPEIARMASWYWKRSNKESKMACASLALKWEKGDAVARQVFSYDQDLMEAEWRLLWQLQCQLLPYLSDTHVTVKPPSSTDLVIKGRSSVKPIEDMLLRLEIS